MVKQYVVLVQSGMTSPVVFETYNAALENAIYRSQINQRNYLVCESLTLVEPQPPKVTEILEYPPITKTE